MLRSYAKDSFSGSAVLRPFFARSRTLRLFLLGCSILNVRGAAGPLGLVPFSTNSTDRGANGIDDEPLRECLGIATRNASFGNDRVTASTAGLRYRARP